MWSAGQGSEAGSWRSCERGGAVSENMRKLTPPETCSGAEFPSPSRRCWPVRELSSLTSGGSFPFSGSFPDICRFKRPRKRPPDSRSLQTPEAASCPVQRREGQSVGTAGEQLGGTGGREPPLRET